MTTDPETPASTERKVTYFLCLTNDKRSHDLLNLIQIFKAHQAYKSHAAYFQTIQYKTQDELNAGVQALLSGGATDSEHLVFVTDVPTESHCTPSVANPHWCKWRIEVGQCIIPKKENERGADRQYGAAQFLVAIFVVNIDERLKTGWYPWGEPALTLAQRRDARKGKSSNRITTLRTVGYTGKRAIPGHIYGDRCDPTLSGWQIG